MPGAWETLHVRIRGDSDLPKTFARDEKAAAKFDKTLGGMFKKYRDEKIEVDVDYDEKKLKSLDSSLKSLSGSIRSTGTVLKASSIPLGIAAIGAATPTVLALSSSVAGLALNLGKAGAGFGLVAGAAGGGALAGLKAYTALISSSVSASREAYTATHEHRMELLEKQKQEILNTKASEAFNKEIDRQILGFSELQAAVGNKVFPLFTKEMQAWGDVLKDNRSEIAGTAGEVARIAVGFTEWFRTAEDGKVLDRTLGFINSSAIKGASTLHNVGITGVMAFQPLIPLATRLQTDIMALANTAAEWTKEAKNQRVLSDIYRSLWADAKAMGPVLIDAGRGLFNILSAIDRAGLSDQASQGLATMADNFERLTREGTESRQKINGFLEDARDLMPYVGAIAGTLANQFFRVANSLISAREKGKRLTILQTTLEGIRQSIKPIADLLISTTKALGPELGPLVRNFAELAETFAGSSSPLVVFVRTLNRMLTIFNDLPAPVKNAAASLAAVKLIFGTMGITAVVAPMGRFASNMLLAHGAASKLAGKSALVGVAGGLARIGLLLAGGIGIAAIAGAFYLAYQRSDKFRKAVNGLADDLATWGKDKFKSAKAAVLDIFDWDKSANQKASDFGVKGAHQFATKYAEQLRREAANQKGERSAGYEFGSKMGKAAEKGFKSEFTKQSAKTAVPGWWWKDAFDMPAGVREGSLAWQAREAVKGFADEIASERSQKRVEKAWAKGMHNPIKAAAKLLPPALMNVWQNITGQADSQFGKTGRTIAQNLEKGGKDGKNSQSRLKTDLTNIWEATKGQATLKWPKIAEAIIFASQRSKERAGQSQRELEQNNKNVWQRILEATPIWGKIASGVVDPTVKAVSDVKQAWSNLLNFLADVVSRLGFKDLAASIRGSVPAGKGSTYGGSAPGGDNPNTKPVERFARGGIHNADRGGVAGPGRMGIVGEAGQKEAIVNLERRTPESQMALRAANRSPNARGGRHAPDRGHRPMGFLPFASGGLWYPKTAGVNSIVESRFGVSGSTYAGHGADGDSRNSVDWQTGQGWGVAATGQFLERGNQIVDYLLKSQKSFTDYIIWQRKMWDAGGVSPYRGGGGYAAPTTVSGHHLDHVHWESLENNAGPHVMGGSSGGVSVPNPVQILYDKLWPRVEGMANKFISPLTSSPKILSQVAGMISKKAVDQFGKKLDEKIPDTIGGGSGGSYTGGGSLDQWLKAGLKLGGAFPPTASNVAKLHSLAMEESSGNPNAVNDLPGSNDPSGLLQVKPTTFAAYKVPGHSNIFDPEDNTAASTRYQKATYGYLKSHAPYARGGIATGPGIVGEAGDDEAIINLNRRTRESQMALRAALASPNARGHRFAAGGLTFNGPLASQAIGVARSFWGPSGASFGYGPGFTVRVREGIGAARTGNGIIGVDPKWVGSDLFDEILGHEIGHAGGLGHVGPPAALMTNPVFRGDRPISSELSAFARNVGVSSAGGSSAGGGSGGSWAPSGGSTNSTRIHSTGGGSWRTSSGQGAASGRARLESAVQSWGAGGASGSPAADIKRGARAGEAQLAELKGLRREIKEMLNQLPRAFGEKLRGREGRDLHKHHQQGIRERLNAAGVF